MKKAFLIIVTLLLACSVAFAGGSKESSSSAQSLRMLWWGGDSRHNATLSALDAYEEKTGVEVSAEYGGWDGYYQRIVTQIAGGTAADLFQIDQPWFYELCSRGDVFVEIDPEIVDLSAFDEAFLESYCVYDGKIMALPTGANVNTLLVDKAMLIEAGIDPDIKWTWENFITEGRKIHDQNPRKYLLGTVPDTLRYWFEIMMAQLAGGVVGENKEILFTADQAEIAFSYIQDLFDYGIIPPYAETSIYYQRMTESPEWINGNYAMAWTWVSTMNVYMGQRNMDTTTFPVLEGAVDTGILMRPSQLYVVSSSTRNPEEALKLLDYMLNDEEAAIIQGTERGIPASSRALNALEEADIISERTVKATNDGMAQAGKPQSTWQMNSEVIDAMQQVIDEFGYGRINARQAAENLIASLERTLSRL